MKKVTYFDVEWANSKNKSICQMGIMCEDFDSGEPFLPESNIYINPEDNFDEMCVQVHGICAERVANKPKLPEIWKKIEPCFTKSIVIGHNVAGADLDALSKALHRYNIDIPEMFYVDTLEIAKNFVPAFAVDNYSMSVLCHYFNISIDSEHDAFDDACANKDLLTAMMNAYNFSIDNFVHRYIPRTDFNFSKYVSSPLLRKSISDFYGIIQGISLDGKLSDLELTYIRQWKKENQQYANCQEVSIIISYIDDIVSDGKITLEELQGLHNLMTSYFETLSSSTITIATQVLSGVLKGISSDGIITTEECVALRKWLYKNDYLKGHYPFDKIITLLNVVLDDNVITKDESDMLLLEIEKVLNPVETLKSQICSVKGQVVCLSGNFAYGQKSDVEKYITNRGGIVNKNVTKKLDILIVGTLECESFANGNYGTKVKKAIEYNQQGSNIFIVKEKDFFKTVK